MDVRLSGLTLELITADAVIEAGWRRMLAGWSGGGAPADIQLELTVSAQLPPHPDLTPFFQTTTSPIISAYRPNPQVTHLYLESIAWLAIPVEATPTRPVRGVITPAGLSQHLLQEVTYLGVAALLRRQGSYLLHAASCAWQGASLLLVGRSGSGKTTTALNLALHGWEHQANDVTLLRQGESGMVAWPTPDEIWVRPATLALLPALHAYQATALTGLEQANTIHLRRLTPRPGLQSTPIAAICFPQVTAGPTRLLPQSQSMALARLLEESLDCWDPAAAAEHTAFLSAMARQAPAYTLHLGRDVARLPGILQAVLDKAKVG